MIFLVLASLGAAPPVANASPADAAFFEARVRPILVRRCQDCHSVRSKKSRGGLLLDSRAAILAGGDSGPSAVPGAPDKSLLIQAVRYSHDSLAMPPKDRLPPEEVRVLEEWVQRGLVFPGAAVAVERGGIDLAAARNFWSFRPLTDHAPPPVHRKDWPRRRIDRFLLAAMEKHGLAPSPEADRRTLVRRLSFDLVGLPPSPEETDQFVRDVHPDACGRLVERLLASPRHGERWGRVWLDLARYCDIAEVWSDIKGARWLYRDWVVKAMNADLPYDEFARKQVAADLMPGADPTDRAALGFLGIAPTYWKELKLDHVRIKGVVAEEWEERIHTFGSTFLGLTVACARCHDHKFDPITAADYYALAGVFASCRQADVSLLPEAVARRVQQAKARLAAIDKERKATKDPVKYSALLSEATALRATPHLNALLVPGVVESSLHVLADGPDRTRLEYRAMPQDVPLQARGDPGNPGPAVPRRFLAVLSPEAPRLFNKGSGRLELAEAITGEARALAARVIVNRVWGHHFGHGIVATPSDFGKQGDAPTHPELLDDLASRFVANGWSLKWLHREIVLSAAYRQASRTDRARNPAADPENRWLSRMARRRLEIEAWRDATVTLTVGLDSAMGGPPLDLDSPANVRRTVYARIKRRELPDLLRLNDFPDPTTHSAGRTPTTTPLQQLFILNSAFMTRHASALAARLRSSAATDAQRIQAAYRLLFSRPATEKETKLGAAFVAVDGWESYAQALLGSNEFLYVD